MFGPRWRDVGVSRWGTNAEHFRFDDVYALICGWLEINYAAFYNNSSTASPIQQREYAQNMHLDVRSQVTGQTLVCLTRTYAVARRAVPSKMSCGSNNVKIIKITQIKNL